MTTCIGDSRELRAADVMGGVGVRGSRDASSHMSICCEVEVVIAARDDDWCRKKNGSAQSIACHHSLCAEEEEER